jgi:hypothetical protein
MLGNLADLRNELLSTYNQNKFSASLPWSFPVKLSHCLFVFVLTVSLGSPCVLAQNPKFPPMPEPSQTQPPSPEDQAKSKLERDMAKKANQERQAALRRDTEKLLKLATELKDYVDKTNENVLSFDVVKKAEEIEKLAHSVKEKMKAN